MLADDLDLEYRKRVRREPVLCSEISRCMNAVTQSVKSSQSLLDPVCCDQQNRSTDDRDEKG